MDKLIWAKDELVTPNDEDIDRVCCEIARMANKHNDNDDWESDEENMICALHTALYDKGLIKGLAIKYGFIK